ncbi:type I-F CRISPR-associated helicase Cas3f [Limnohabitans sp. G3-2]|uniref:type I-F CRISPR-associated helicase Cas3f n=1 Tax=Limnohabitans sp. G3-2 TaxID=1100711 RepID=UPI000C1E1C65|nr:type I-F CRISPR-associated helicase Cas3f [Limnohabitans sp. G3-2]PIT76881.1 type I-F CRISPR-associated helicase Cas3 [Limnohabitans sp. G3-2]
MNVLFVSQCEKRALTETRRILDQFAERRGERTWQTTITQMGLNTVRKLLRQTARKNTAVACHWIRGLDHSELLWVVGDSKQFNAVGATPTNTTQRKILRQDDENDWHTGHDIHLLTVLAALLHDLGKASVAFQKRLTGDLTERNQYRHEWVSLRLFQAFVGQDSDAQWLSRLVNPTQADDESWTAPERFQRDGVDSNTEAPFVAMQNAPLAQAVAWLVVTHHRLPQEPDDNIDTEAALADVLQNVTAYWNEDSRPRSGKDDDESETTNRPTRKALPVEAYWDIPASHLPVTTALWRKRAARVAQGLLKRLELSKHSAWLGNPYLMHVTRLCLMLADHHYSRLSFDVKDGKPVAMQGRVEGQTHASGKPNFPVYANTYFDKLTNKTVFNQTLDEHLLGVAQHGGEVTRALPSLQRELPGLCQHKGLKKPSTELRFRWQNKAFDLASSLRTNAHVQGAFIVNLAATGSGKTLANARIMYALADPAKGMRCAFSLGLRTLTLQTGRAFQSLLNLSEEDLAIRVGGAAQKALFEHQQQEAEKSGSASAQDLMDEGSHVLFEGNPDAHPLLKRVLHDAHSKSLITAPLLVCTIDHLVPATESTRGGHQIAPMLRLMSSDLVLDEPDDFDMADLPALTRLVFWAGLLGSRVLLSSATLPPDMVQGLFAAYARGRAHFQANRGEPGLTLNVCCLWVDEFDVQHSACPDAARFAAEHQQFVTQRLARLKRPKPEQERPARLAQLAKLDLKEGPNNPEDLPRQFAERIAQLASKLHQAHHSPDTKSTKRVSFGLVRMANIEPLVQVARALYQHPWPEGLHVHLCTYHSQYPLLLRSRIEQQLDAALNRKTPNAVFDLPDIRQRINAHAAQDQLFIVLGSPVTEVGRDHDYDWAIVEPSSMRSLIQLAGRVRRHRPLKVGETHITTPNIRVFQYNYKHWKQSGKAQPCFVKPGFENTCEAFKLKTHDMAQLIQPLLNKQAMFTIDASPRLQAPAVLNVQTLLPDLEHARMQDTMLARTNSDAPLNAATCWHLPPHDATLTATLPRMQPFRYDKSDKRKEVEFRLMPNEEGDAVQLEKVVETRQGWGKKTAVWISANSEWEQLPDKHLQAECISPWCASNYLQALSDLAEQLDMPMQDCAQKFGGITLKESKDSNVITRWQFHHALGFERMK